MLKRPTFDYLMTIPSTSVEASGHCQRLDFYVRSYDHLREIAILTLCFLRSCYSKSTCSELSNIVLSVYFATRLILIVVINYRPTCCISICDVTFINTFINTGIPVLIFLIPLIRVSQNTYGIGCPINAIHLTLTCITLS